LDAQAPCWGRRSPIEVFYPRDYVEQSSADIWRAVGGGAKSPAPAVHPLVAGIAFDATCSLVALNRESPITSPHGDPDRNVIVWMDHRAAAQAEQINATAHPVLRYVGGTISPEQEPPKLRWLKENIPQTWANAGKFLDLADYLVLQACGDDVRSQCTVVCKWTYLGHEGAGGAWDMSFFRQIGLEVFSKAGGRTQIAPVGSRAGTLTSEAARHLG
jgi:ribulose kinase